MKPTVWLQLGILLAVAMCTPGRSAAADGTRAPAVNYNRDVRPILSNNCFKCHGPDAAERKAGLRLDSSVEAGKPTESGARAIVPSQPDESELVARVFATDESLVMPPPESNKRLTATEKETLRRWIAAGAEYQQHWSFNPPLRAALPAVTRGDWPRNAIDRFILARLEREGLQPSREADRPTLIRRLTLDLTGLPPTPAEIDAFLLDSSPEAYERVVDRLLASPHFGERLAVDWLDAARFADTNGYHIDNGRDMTHWREWVIGAFNKNLPFDRFTIEQLAGDLLPNPTVEQQIASGFNRNHMINFEGGAIPEEYHTAYIVDRVNTTGTVWLGLTVGCVQCHDHKYDPLTQKDYYRLYAFFHNVPENGLDGRTGNAPPLLKLPSAEQQARLGELAASIAALEARLAGPIAEIDAAQDAWEREAAAHPPAAWTTLAPVAMHAESGAVLNAQEDHAILATGENAPQDTYTLTLAPAAGTITALRVEALPDDSLPAKGPGRSANGNIVLTAVRIEAAPAASAGDSAGPTVLPIKGATADHSQQDYAIAAAVDDKPDTGWAILPEAGKAHAAVFALATPWTSGPGLRLQVTLEFRSQFAQHQLGKFRLAVTSAPNPHGQSTRPESVEKILAVASADRSDAQRAELRKYFRENLSPEIKQLNDQLAAARKAHKELDQAIPTTMVMQEKPEPRETFMLVRGQYDKHGERVTAGVPESLPPLPADAPANRLGLARWLVDRTQPLVPRVTVNRYWQLFFGTGLVKTAEDFGSQGELPSHPELLDWLAVEFMEPSAAPLGTGSTTPWDVKALCRLIVTSATYRQTSAATAESRGRDPDNRLLARGARQRLIAEFIRDQALAASGLLNATIGGPSVSPYQPAGLWEELAYRADGSNWTAQSYTQSHGPDLYRRTMYTFWKRTSPPPTLTTFDAPDRETCTVRRATTNTPLQALVLLNDPTYVEASRKLAERMMLETPAADERIGMAFRLATGRRPTTAEVAVLRRVFEEQLAMFRAQPEAATRLLAVGESPRNEQLEAGELAAWTAVASVILNLDETVTKN